MRTRIKILSGQATTELALLLPILCFLLYWIIAGYRANHFASENSIQRHAQEVKEFDLGNGTITLENGMKVPAGTLTTALIPRSYGNLGNLLSNMALNTMSQLGLNNLLSRIPFLNQDTYLSGALKGGFSSMGNSFISSGFKKVDWESVGWGATAGGFSSGQATEDFQGNKFASSSLREAAGSTAQSTVVGWAQGEGNDSAALSGSFQGLLNSDTSKQWFASGNDVLKGAARGAIEGSVAGIFEGKIDLTNVAISAGMGAFNTKTVASAIPFTDWSGHDPRQSASFGAINSALGTFLSGGNAKDALYASTAGAFFSDQSMKTVAGDSTVRAAAAGASYGAGIGLLKGQEASAVGRSALVSMVQTVAWQRIPEVQKQFQEALGQSSSTNALSKAAFSGQMADMVANEYSAKLMGYLLLNDLAKSLVTYKRKPS